MRKKRGFTIIEVSLFLAITGVIFAGIAVGTQNSIFWQRYNDSIQSFAEFLRTVYSQVNSVQSDGAGNSEEAMYGRLVVFGKNEGSDKNVITSYTVFGDANASSTAGGILAQLGPVENGGVGAKIKTDKGFVASYTPRWGSQIQTIDSNIFTGALLVVRHPSSGIVYTLYSSGGGLAAGGSAIDIGSFSVVSGDGIDFCVNPNGAGESDLRKDVRIVAGARNSSDIVVEPDSKNKCTQSQGEVVEEDPEGAEE